MWGRAVPAHSRALNAVLSVLPTASFFVLDVETLERTRSVAKLITGQGVTFCSTCKDLRLFSLENEGGSKVI